MPLGSILLRIPANSGCTVSLPDRVSVCPNHETTRHLGRRLHPIRHDPLRKILGFLPRKTRPHTTITYAG
jgi:hypothetical protein